MSSELWEHRHRALRYAQGETSLDEILVVLGRRFPGGFSADQAYAFMHERFGTYLFTAGDAEFQLPDAILANGLLQRTGQDINTVYHAHAAMISWLGPLRVHQYGREQSIAAGARHLATYGISYQAAVRCDAERGSSGDFAVWQAFELINPFTYQLRSRIWTFGIGWEQPRLFHEESIIGEHLEYPPYPDPGMPCMVGNTIMLRRNGGEESLGVIG